MLRHFPDGRTARFRIAMGATLTASLLAAALTASGRSAASGDRSLTHHQHVLSSRLANSHGDLDDISGRLVAAQRRLDGAVADLGRARSRVAALRADVEQATARDQQMAEALQEARQRLRDAQADLRRGEAAVERQRGQVAGYAVSDGPTEVTQLSTLDLLFSARTTQQALDRLQANQSAVDTQLTGLQRLQANQVLLRYTEQRVQDDTRRVATARAAAAAHLAATQALESQAASAEAGVRDQVVALHGTRDRLAAAKARELARIRAMERERAAVEARLQRIAEQRAAERSAERSAAGESGSGSTSALATSADGGYLSYPVRDTYVTSPYGMRLHPILHIWELHDGTDFHAPCGTPVYAAADGKVTSEYYSSGYGNRLMLDNGFVRGVSLWTSYNHLTSYVASVGDRVGRGQLIAYSGTTGLSTACHLHFMVYVNGVTVNPMTWL